MDGGHEAFIDSESLFQKDVHDGGEAIGGAAGVGNNVMRRWIVFLVVDADDDRDVFIFSGSGNDDFFSAGRQVTFGFFTFGEEAG